jgi:hypothetical protein
MLFLQSTMINLVLTNSSGLKRHAVLFTVSIFAGFCLCHTDLGGGGALEIAAFPPPPAAPAPHPDFSLQYPSTMAVGRSAHQICGLSSPQAVS